MMRAMGSKNYTDVLIGGKIYTLGGLEEESYLQQVASYINEKLEELRRQAGFQKQSEDYQSVMVYLNLADDYFKEREHARVLADQKGELEKETYSLKHELVGTQMRLETALDGKTRKERSQEDAEREAKAREAEVDDLRRKLAAAEERAGQAGDRADRMREELEGLRDRADGMREELEGLRDRATSAERLLAETKERLKAAEERAWELERQKSALEERFSGAAGQGQSAGVGGAGQGQPAMEAHPDRERPDDAQYRAMKEELEKYRALEAARNSSRMQKGHR